MLTWETLTKCVENECLDEDLRLIAQLLVELKFTHPNTDMKTIFERSRQRALDYSTTHYKHLVK